MRVLVLTQMYPPHHLGGYELSCHDVMEVWRRTGHDVEVLTTTFRLPQESRDTIPSVPVHRELRFYWDEHRIVRPPLPQRIRIERANQAALKRILSDFRPDVVSAWHMGAMSLGLLQTIVEDDIPMVLVVADQWLIYGGAVDAWTSLFAGRPRLARLARRLTGLPTAWVPRVETLTTCFASEWLRRRTLEGSTFPLGRTAVTQFGIDPRRFEPALERRPWSWQLLCAGRVEDRKGVHVAVEALAHLPEATLEVDGPGEPKYVQSLQRRAGRLGVRERVRFTRTVERRELPDKYRSADVFLFPVLWDEPFGLAPLEAMACGTPVIATGTGGSAEFLDDGRNCLLVPKRDAAALADAVRRLAVDADLRTTLVEHGRATVERLSIDRLADVLERFHLEAAARYSDGVPPDGPGVSPTGAPSANEHDRDA